MSYTIIDVPTDCSKVISLLKAGGITHIIRYDDRLPSGSWKQIHSPEVHAIRDEGLRLAIVYEGAGATVSTFSEQSGYLDAKYSRSQAASRGQPDGSAIYFAVDFDATAAEMQARIVPYFQGVKRAFEEASNNPVLKVGVYGSGLCCKTLKALGLVSFTWITCSRGFNGSKEYIAAGLQDLWQVQCDKTLHGLSIDYNEAKNPDWGHFVPWEAPVVPPVVTPPPQITHDATWLQEILAKAGLYHGQIDGDAGPLTIAGMIAAIERFNPFK